MNSLDKYMEDEWNQYIANNSGMSIKDMMEMEGDNCKGDCDDCLCSNRESKDKVETKAEKRKATPIYSGFIKYFPDAIREVAKCSQVGNDQHHKDKPLHWDRNKSGDELDAAMRHLTDHAAGIEFDDDGVRHLTKTAWRLLAMLQKTMEENRKS